MFNLTFKKETRIDDWFITSNLKEVNGFVYVSMINPLGDNDKGKFMTLKEVKEVFNIK